MFKNAFANLQKVGKSLMLPVSVLPIAGILLGVGSANFSWLPAVVSHVMAEAGGSVFANMPLIFAIGVALGFTNNDGVSALASVVAYGIMVKTMAVVAPLVLHLPAEEIAAKHLADTGVLGGLSPVRLQRICSTVSTVSNCLSILASLRVSASFLSFLVWPLSSPVWFCPSFGRRSGLLFRRFPSGLHTRTRS